MVVRKAIVLTLKCFYNSKVLSRIRRCPLITSSFYTFTWTIIVLVISLRRKRKSCLENISGPHTEPCVIGTVWRKCPLWYSSEYVELSQERSTFLETILTHTQIIFNFLFLKCFQLELVSISRERSHSLISIGGGEWNNVCTCVLGGGRN